MVHVIQTEALPSGAVGPSGVAGDAGEGARVRRIITPETVGAERVEAEQYELPAGSSSQTFLLDDERQFFYVLHGRAEARLGETRQPVRPGHGIYAEPGEGCRFSDCGEEGFRFLRFVIPGGPGRKDR
ncbi:MAG: cupin domain-containing protein [Nitrospinota bacterium]